MDFEFKKKNEETCASSGIQIIVKFRTKCHRYTYASSKSEIL